jgi:hypothetical protein
LGLHKRSTGCELSVTIRRGIGAWRLHVAMCQPQCGAPSRPVEIAVVLAPN